MVSGTVIVNEDEVEYITVAEFLDALEKNGYKHIRGSFVRETSKLFGLIKEKGACALGQAALNLGVYPVSLRDALNKLNYAGDNIIRYNDSYQNIIGIPRLLSYDEIVGKAREMLSPYMEKKIPVVKMQNSDWNTSVYSIGGWKIK
jgi:hypothetical protein